MSKLKFPGTTNICHKLLWVCYYYARWFGLIAFGVKIIENNSQTRSNLQETVIIRNIDVQTSTSRRKQGREILLQAYANKTMLWLHILLRFILCCCSSYFLLKASSLEQDYIFTVLICSQVATIFICPSSMAIVEIWHNEKLINAFNSLVRLLSDVRELHSSNEIFQWTHVTFVALKIVTFVFEIFLVVQGIYICDSIDYLVTNLTQCVLLVEIWLNIHAVTLLYLTIDALYGGLNHYMRHQFIPRIRAVQALGHVITEAQVDRLTMDMTRFMDLFKTIQRVGTELHSLWQLSVASTLVCIYFGLITVIYIIVWQYYETDTIYMEFIPFTLKFPIDILLLSLAAHRAIKSSQSIGFMGLENVMLVENDKWHKQMDHFLCHLNLYEFKLNFLGLFDMSNAFTLTFIDGILTSITIFVPFSIKTYRRQKILGKQNGSSDSLG